MPRLSYLNLGLIAVNALALVVLAVRYESPGEIEIISREAPGNLDRVVVHVSGAVHEPGVYRVNPGDRVAEIVELAGGLTSEADERRVNLALRLRDEDRIHIPSMDEEVGAGPTSELVDLNRASATELEGLPGIGPVYAGRIIEAREVRPFASTDELLEREVIPAHVYERIRLLVTVVP